MSVTVYTRDNCQACKATKILLNRYRVEYTEVNVENNLDLAQQLVDEGYRAMPIVKTELEEWSGHRPHRIEKYARIGA